MKNIKSLLIERRQPNNYKSNSTILCNVDELDEICDCIEKGCKAINFDLNDEKNRFHIITQTFKSLKDISRVGDSVELKIRLAPDEKEGDR